MTNSPIESRAFHVELAIRPLMVRMAHWPGMLIMATLKGMIPPKRGSW